MGHKQPRSRTKYSYRHESSIDTRSVFTHKFRIDRMNSKILALGLTVGCLSLSHSLALSALNTPQQPPRSIDSIDPNHRSGNLPPSGSLTQATTKTCAKTKEGYGFPKTTGYIKGYQIKSKTGLSEVTVDNSRNTFDVYRVFRSNEVQLEIDPKNRTHESIFGRFTRKNSSLPSRRGSIN